MIYRLFSMLFWHIMPLYKGGGKGGGGGGGGTQTVVNEPWSEQVPYLKDIFSQAQTNHDSPPDYFPNATYVPFSAQSNTAMQLAQNRALQGSELTTAGKQQTLNTINGDYLNSNPWLDKQFDRAAGAVSRNYREAVAPSIDSQFSSAGRYGSELHTNAHDQAQDNLGRTLDGMATNMYGGNYATERQNQLNAIGVGQTLANNDYNDIAQLSQVGGAVEGKAGEMLNDQINRFNYYQNLPDNQLAKYASIINSGNWGGTQTSESQSPDSNNTLSNLVGAGFAAASLFGGGGLF